MAATIIYLVISLLVSLIFIILGVQQCKSKTPVSINTGEKPPREEELISVSEWNRRHGRNFIVFGCILFITLTAFVCCIERFEYTAVQVIVFLLIVFGEIAWIEIDHHVMKKKMIKKQ